MSDSERIYTVDKTTYDALKDDHQFTGGIMRNPNRIKPLLKLIETIWTAYPDLRLTQLLSNAVGDSVYHLEDDKLTFSLVSTYHQDLDDESIRPLRDEDGHVGQ